MLIFHANFIQNNNTNYTMSIKITNKLTMKVWTAYKFKDEC